MAAIHKILDLLVSDPLVVGTVIEGEVKYDFYCSGDSSAGGNSGSGAGGSQSADMSNKTQNSTNIRKNSEITLLGTRINRMVNRLEKHGWNKKTEKTMVKACENLGKYIVLSRESNAIRSNAFWDY